MACFPSVPRISDGEESVGRVIFAHIEHTEGIVTPMETRRIANERSASPRAASLRKPYRTPSIIHEVEIEARAGSPLFLEDPVSGQTQNPWDPTAAGSQR